MHAFSCKTLRTTVIISCTIKNPSSPQLSIHYTCDKNEMVVNIPVFFFSVPYPNKEDLNDVYMFYSLTTSRDI